MKYMVHLSLLMSLLLVSGCTPEINLGPRTRDAIVYVRTTDKDGKPIKIGRVAQNVKVKIEMVTDKGEHVIDTVDIGGWDVVPPTDGPVK